MLNVFVIYMPGEIETRSKQNASFFLQVKTPREGRREFHLNRGKMSLPWIYYMGYELQNGTLLIPTGKKNKMKRGREG